MNCWEFMKCGRHAGGENVRELGVCEAYPDNGKKCASIAGSLGGERQGLFALKQPSCWVCDFYRSVHYNRPSNAEKAVGAIG
jgi:hypothetical protein